MSGSGSGSVNTPPNGEPPETDLDSIGHHCDLEYCHQLDFLPFRCASCRGVFCLDHRTESAHQCPRAGEWARSSSSSAAPTTSTPTSASTSSTPPTKPNIHNTAQCSHLACKTLIHTLSEPGVRCPECRREYCLKHRLREGHACQPFPRSGGKGGGGAGPGQDTLKSMFARVRGSFASLASGGSGGGGGNAGKSVGDKNKGATATATATAAAAAMATKKNKPVNRAMAVNALKRTAKGDAAVPAERRVYLSVEAAAAPTRSAAAAAAAAAAGAAGAAGAFWFDGKWKVGRVLDDAARRLGVENVNNRVAGEEERLRVFHVDGGVFLEFGDTLGEKVVAGDTLVLLRGAGVIL